MSKSAFAQTIIGKLDAAIGKDGLKYTEDFASTAMQAVADGITDYITGNTTVMISYTGTTSSGPDPVVADTFKVTGKCAKPSPSDSFDSWMKEVESKIIAGFTLEKQGKAGVQFPTDPFKHTGVSTVQSHLKSAHDISDESPQQKVWEVVCGGIMDWINGAAMNTTGGSAKRPSGSSTGTAQITKITIT